MDGENGVLEKKMAHMQTQVGKADVQAGLATTILQSNTTNCMDTEVLLGIDTDETDRETMDEEGDITNKPFRSYILKLLDFVSPVIAALVISFILTRVIFFNGYVPSGSMETTIMTHDRIVATRLSYLSDSPKYGDVVVFWSDELDEYLVKRVIGVGGDHIQLLNGHVYVNGRMTCDDYTQGISQPGYSGTTDWDVPEDSLFLMGDNRGNSADSRYWDNPFVAVDEVKGKVFCRYSIGGDNGWFAHKLEAITFWQDELSATHSSFTIMQGFVKWGRVGYNKADGKNDTTDFTTKGARLDA